jgi:hypothetical protein
MTRLLLPAIPLLVIALAGCRGEPLGVPMNTSSFAVLGRPS